MKRLVVILQARQQGGQFGLRFVIAIGEPRNVGFQRGQLHVLGVEQAAKFRLRRFRAALEHIARQDDRIWLATPGEIAAHYAGIVPPPTGPAGVTPWGTPA